MADEPGVEDSSDEEADEQEPTVELGDGEPVSGAPIARIASRLTWPQERSEIDRKVGDTLIRTPEGPTTLSSILAEVDTTYFARRQDFVEAVRAVVGVGPIPTD